MMNILKKEQALSEEDIQRLMADHSVNVRNDTLKKLSVMYAQKDFMEKERRIAEEIFRIAAKDIEEQIRQTLSVNLAVSEDLPQDVAKTLATDTSDAVAAPILQYSKSLSSQDLIEIVKTGNEARQTAVASRAIVEEEVASAIAVHGHETAVQTLVRNEGAQISEQSFHTVVDRFAKSENIQKTIADRKSVPESVVVRVLEHAGEGLQKYIISKHRVDPEKLKNIIKFSYEKAMISVSSTSSDEEIRAVIYGLAEKNKLTPTLILRSLCVGETPFFENAVSFLTNIPIENIRKLIYDKGLLGLPALYRQANLPDTMFPAAKIAVGLIQEIGYRGGNPDIQDSFSRMVVGRLMEELGVDDDETDIDMLLGMLLEDEEAV